jgi:hypothetical protein
MRQARQRSSLPFNEWKVTFYLKDHSFSAFRSCSCDVQAALGCVPIHSNSLEGLVIKHFIGKW